MSSLDLTLGREIFELRILRGAAASVSDPTSRTQNRGRARFKPLRLIQLDRSAYFSTFTPFQNATYPVICFAASFGSG